MKGEWGGGICIFQILCKVSGMKDLSQFFYFPIPLYIACVHSLFFNNQKIDLFLIYFNSINVTYFIVNILYKEKCKVYRIAIEIYKQIEIQSSLEAYKCTLIINNNLIIYKWDSNKTQQLR